MKSELIDASALAAGLAALAVLLLRRCAARLPHAHPNDRTLHASPIPRVGGLAIWAGWLPAAILFPPHVGGPWAVWLCAWAALAAISLRDDWKGTAIVLRLGVQAIAAMVVTAAIMTSPENVHVSPIAIATMPLIVLWGANLFNFMDGSDGLAAAMAIVGFAGLAAGAAQAGEAPAAYVALCAAMVPVLAVNRPRASMFLGDVGAVPIGFLAAGLGCDGVLRDAWPWWFPLLVFLPFIADATATLGRRVLRGERFWQAHRSHYYQRLLQLGCGHGGTLIVYALLMIGCASAAVGCLAWNPAAGPAALAAFCVMHTLLFAGIDYHWGQQGESR